jgi:hypothetical protein
LISSGQKCVQAGGDPHCRHLTLIIALVAELHNKFGVYWCCETGTLAIVALRKFPPHTAQVIEERLCKAMHQGHATGGLDTQNLKPTQAVTTSAETAMIATGMMETRVIFWSMGRQ